jgi:hypothetical protein
MAGRGARGARATIAELYVEGEIVLHRTSRENVLGAPRRNFDRSFMDIYW